MDRDNSPGPIIRQVGWDEGLQRVEIKSLAIVSDRDQIILFAGQMGEKGMNMLQKAVIEIDELKRFF